jgi:cytochrome c oxidase cbb3-type subunit 3
MTATCLLTNLFPQKINKYLIMITSILNSKKPLFLLLLCSMAMLTFAQSTNTVPEKEWSSSDNINAILAFIAFILLFPIYFMGKMFSATLKNYMKKLKNLKNGMAIISFFIISNSLIAQAATTETTVSYWDTINFTTWFLLVTIIIEIFVLFFLGLFTARLMKNPKKEIEKAEKIADESWFMKWWKKANNFNNNLEEAEKLDTGHSYDGIRELDNITPPWFQAAFYTTIVIGIIYLWYYHSGVGKLQIEEYQESVDIANKEMDEYQKHQKGIDENTIAFTTAGSELEEGAKLYQASCASCHAADGGGGTGPNLCDDSWIHGGSPKDIFKSIKYGWKEKGMIPWKDLYNDQKILKIASYMNTFQGKKPLSPKAPQGDKYVPVADTTAKAVTTDSTVIAAK